MCKLNAYSRKKTGLDIRMQYQFLFKFLFRSAKPVLIRAPASKTTNGSMKIPPVAGNTYTSITSLHPSRRYPRR